MNVITEASHIKTEHLAHLKSEGFTDQQIDLMQSWGVRSLDKVEAEAMNLRVKSKDGAFQSSDGLYFPFTKDFGQIRCDNPLIRANGDEAKYLTPGGAQSQAWLPDGCKVVTEGFKDAAAGSLHGGIPTGAIAGVSHYRKTLKEGCKVTILFDADGWRNPQIILNLFNAGLWTRGKIQLVPEIEDKPKAGLCEYFGAGHIAKDYKELIAGAMKPTAFLMALPDHWRGMEESQLLECAKVVMGLASRHLKEIQQEALILKIHKVSGVRLKILKGEMSRIHKAFVQSQRQKIAAENAAESGAGQERDPYALPVKRDRFGNVVLPASSAVANILAKKYRSTLAWNTESISFYRYEAQLSGVWTVEPEDFVYAMLQAELNATDLAEIYGAGYISSIFRLMRGHLAVRGWDEKPGLLPLENGVVDLATGKLLPHAPGYRLTWQLPYEFDPSATCQPIEDWMLQAQDGDAQRVQLLRAGLKATVTSRVDLQRFFELLGPGGTGKTTYMKLAIALVGIRNTYTTTLKALETNQFETSGIYGKRLLLINDADRYGGSVSTLKALTGQDTMRYEEKNKQRPSGGFVPKAIVMIAANEAIQSSDYTSGLERRRLSIPFLNQIEVSDRRNLITVSDSDITGEFVPYLPGLLNWVLALPDQQMEQLIKNPELHVPGLRAWKKESLIATNPIAEWLDTNCIFVSGAKTQVGTATKIRRTESEIGSSRSWEEYKNTESWLYANYRSFVDSAGVKPIAIRRFSDLLEDLCQRQLGRSDVRKHRVQEGVHFEGLAIRLPSDKNTPNPITGDQSMLAKVLDNAGSMKAETVGNVDSDGYVGFFEPSENLQKKLFSDADLEPPQSDEIIFEERAEVNSNLPAYPAHSTLPTVSAFSHPSPMPTAPTVAEIARPAQFKLGDRVKEKAKRKNMEQRSGLIVKINGADYQFQDEKSGQLVWQPADQLLLLAAAHV